jgi:hypothetical protein
LFHALRREELCKLKVKDFRHARKGVPHLKVSGKGGKTRYLPLDGFCSLRQPLSRPLRATHAQSGSNIFASRHSSFGQFRGAHFRASTRRRERWMYSPFSRQPMISRSASRCSM